MNETLKRVEAKLEPYRDKTLGFGCEVICGEENNQRQYILTSDSSYKDGYAYCVSFSGQVCSDSILRKSEISKILGHPIDLQVLVHALRSQNIDEAEAVRRYDPTKQFNEQPEEYYVYLNVILATQ